MIQWGVDYHSLCVDQIDAVEQIVKNSIAAYMSDDVPPSAVNITLSAGSIKVDAKVSAMHAKLNNTAKEISKIIKPKVFSFCFSPKCQKRHIVFEGFCYS